MSSSLQNYRSGYHHHSVPDNMPPENVDYKLGCPVLRCIEPRHPLSLSQLFGERADPEKIIRYPRYLDEPDVKCTQCSSSVKLSRIPYQNGCRNCKVKGLKIVFFCFLFTLFGCFLLSMGMNLFFKVTISLWQPCRLRMDGLRV